MTLVYTIDGIKIFQVDGRNLYTVDRTDTVTPSLARAMSDAARIAKFAKGA